MSKRNNSKHGRNAPLILRRHCHTVSLKDGGELVDGVAEIVAQFVKTGGKVRSTEKREEAGSQAHRPDEPANEPA